MIMVHKQDFSKYFKYLFKYVLLLANLRQQYHFFLTLILKNLFKRLNFILNIFFLKNVARNVFNIRTQFHYYD